MPIDRSSLKFLREWKRGPFGSVHEIRAPKKLAAARTCAYRELRGVDAAMVSNLQALIRFRAELSDADRCELDSFAAWPLEVVTSDDDVVGYVTPAIPEAFVEGEIAQSSGTVATLRTVDWLVGPRRARRSGAQVVVGAGEVVTRMVVCAEIARALHFLHTRGIVVGDLGQTGVMFGAAPVQIMLIGLESARVEGVSPPIAQPHAPGTTPPECRGGQAPRTVHTDRFKAGVLFHEILGAGAPIGPTLSVLRGILDHVGIGLFAAALGENAAKRPAADAWYRLFYDRVQAATRPPRIDSFEVTPPRGLRGQVVEVSWVVSGPRSLVLETPWGESRDLDISAGNSVQLPLHRSGQFKLIVANPYGTAEQESEVVLVFDAPTVEFIAVPDLGSMSGVVTGLDVEKMQATVMAEQSYSWMDSLLEMSGREQFRSAGELLDRAVPPPIDMNGLFATVDDVMVRAERRVRRRHRLDTAREWVRRLGTRPSVATEPIPDVGPDAPTEPLWGPPPPSGPWGR